MKILYIITSGDAGGAQKYVLKLAHHFNSSVASGIDSSNLREESYSLDLEYFGIKNLIRKINPYRDYLAIWEIRKLVKKHKPDIVHVNSSKAGLLGSLACIHLSVKVIFTAHGFIFKEPMSLYKKWFYIFWEWLGGILHDTTITVSNEDFKLANKYKLANPKTLIYIPNGIKTPNFFSKIESREILQLNQESWLFGSVANLFPTKGIETLIDAVNIFFKSHKPTNSIMFLVFGEGEERDRLTKKIQELNLVNHILLPGYRKNICDYLMAFDCLIVPSNKEGMPFAGIEALYSGLPIISSNLPSLKETFQNAAIYFEKKDPEKLAEQIQIILTDSNLRNKLGKEAKTISLEFTEEKMITQTQLVYKNLLNKKTMGKIE